ncbi:hypothetical protein DKX38_013471 [Salix brachista]|uniref:Uncharacterized protein n=1 Tax=Salix brachista TaxID=2182728 RepID=A0A5N5LRP4_9ROSI|nr:hypothetical protein DKX38_013471 [Salix brachista]
MDGQDADDAKKSTADMTAFCCCLVRVVEGVALADLLNRFYAGAKFAPADVNRNNFTGTLCTMNLIDDALNMLLIGFLDCNALDDMGTRIDELEQSIDDLRSEMGLEGSPSPSVPPKAKAEPKSGNDSA